MSIYFKGYSGPVWEEYASYTFGSDPVFPDNYPTVHIPYPAGIQAGDVLIAMSKDNIIDDNFNGVGWDWSDVHIGIDLNKWHPVGAPTGVGKHLGYWAIADGTESGSLWVQTGGYLSEFWEPAGVSTGMMMAWTARSISDGEVFWAWDGYTAPSDPTMNFPARSGVTGDISIGLYILEDYLGPSSSPETGYGELSMTDYGVYTPEFEVASTYSLVQDQIYGSAVQYTIDQVTYGAAIYPLTNGTIPAQTFRYTPNGNPFTGGGSGIAWQGLYLGSLTAAQGYWGVLASKL